MKYKYSIYNSILNIDNDSHILYNALSDRFILLREVAYRDFFNYNANYLKEQNSILFNQLVSINSIIEDTFDEYKCVLERIRQNDNDDSIYHLHINPTVDCNFKCWYCYEDHIKGSKMPTEVIESVKRLMYNIIDNQINLRTFNLSFFGGEPLMFFHIIAKPLIEYIHTLCTPKGIKVNIHFTSNGFLLNNAIVEFLQDKSVCFQITLDGWKDTHNKTRFTKGGAGSYNKIISNIIQLVRSNIKVILRINYTSTNIFGVSNILNDIDTLEQHYRQNICIDFQRVWQDANAECDDIVIEHLNESIKLFHSKGFRVSSHKILDSVSNSCYGDKRYHALVNYNGDVFNCTARNFNFLNRAGYLRSDGTIVWENNSLEKRLASKFSKSVCHSCRIAPLCGGGCCQRALESNNGDSCIYSYSDADIDQIIINRFEFMLINQN